VFLLCERSGHDPAYARYPRLPVVDCHGFDPADGSNVERPARSRPSPHAFDGNGDV
jgi:hypothetical protein